MNAEESNKYWKYAYTFAILLNYFGPTHGNLNSYTAEDVSAWIKNQPDVDSVVSWDSLCLAEFFQTKLVRCVSKSFGVHFFTKQLVDKCTLPVLLRTWDIQKNLNEALLENIEVTKEEFYRRMQIKYEKDKIAKEKASLVASSLNSLGATEPCVKTVSSSVNATNAVLPVPVLVGGKDVVRSVLTSHVANLQNENNNQNGNVMPDSSMCQTAGEDVASVPALPTPTGTGIKATVGRAHVEGARQEQEQEQQRGQGQGQRQTVEEFLYLLQEEQAQQLAEAKRRLKQVRQDDDDDRSRSKKHRRMC
jgi:hypothetical protein